MTEKRLTAYRIQGTRGRRYLRSDLLALLTPDEEVELVKLAVVMSNRPRGGGIAKQLAALVHERKKVRPSPSTAYGILERVTARLFPGQKPTYLNERSGHLTRLWLPELPDEQRRRYALFFRF